MRQKRNIRQRKKSLGNVGFILKDIETGGSNNAALQGIDQRLLIHGRAASDIDQHALRPQGLQHLGIDGPAGALGSGAR